MSHRHWCDFAGHEWECKGYATRLYDTGPTPCMCIQHGVSMEEGDHSECSIELLACPEHRDEQRQAMGWTPGEAWPPPQAEPEESTMFLDKDGNHTVGFCLWCGRDFYSMEQERQHTDNGMAECAEFQRYKDEVRKNTPEGLICIPPMLQALFDEADLAESEGKNEAC